MKQLRRWGASPRAPRALQQPSCRVRLRHVLHRLRDRRGHRLRQPVRLLAALRGQAHRQPFGMRHAAGRRPRVQRRREHPRGHGHLHGSGPCARLLRAGAQGRQGRLLPDEPPVHGGSRVHRQAARKPPRRDPPLQPLPASPLRPRRGRGVLRALPHERRAHARLHRADARRPRPARRHRQQERDGGGRRPRRHGGGARGGAARVRRHAVRAEGQRRRPAGVRREREGPAREHRPHARLPRAPAGSDRRQGGHGPGGGRRLREAAEPRRRGGGHWRRA